MTSDLPPVAASAMLANASPERLEEKRRAFVRQRRIATGLLVLAAAVFVVLRLVPEPNFWVLLARAGAEAALVGGLADWFAVTALFRHPLGLPIPHTAIIPRNQERIGQGIGGFIERNFLAPEVVLPKLHALEPARRLGEWLRASNNAEALAIRLTALLPTLLNSLHEPDVREAVRRVLYNRLHAADFAPVLGRLLEILTQTGHHHVLFDEVLNAARRLLSENEEAIYSVVAERSRWWVPETVDRRIAEALVKGVMELLDELADMSHPARARFEAAVIEAIENLRHSPEYRDKVARIKDQILDNPAVQDALGQVWDDLRRALENDVRRPDSAIRQAFFSGLGKLGDSLSTDTGLQARVDRRIDQFVTSVIVPWRTEIARFIADVVRRWDTRTLTARLEIEVGRDLQYIRMNGTLVGALVGCLLFLLSEYAFWQ